MHISALSNGSVKTKVSQLRINMSYAYPPPFFYISQGTVRSDNFLGITARVSAQRYRCLSFRVEVQRHQRLQVVGVPVSGALYW